MNWITGSNAMPEELYQPQPLCASADLTECGDAVLFEVSEHGRSVSAFALRYRHQLLGYLNRCAHVPVEMDWQPGKFWDMDRRHLICAVHGAMYDPPTGRCVSGPCIGKRLQAIRLEERDGQVYWYPSGSVRPACP